MFIPKGFKSDNKLSLKVMEFIFIQEANAAIPSVLNTQTWI